MLSIKQLKTRHIGPVDLELEPEESIAISGSSGSGKSILLRAIADLDPHDGQVFLSGESQQSMPAPKWRKKIGYLSANPGFWEETVARQFEVHDSEQLLQYLKSLGLDEAILPKSIVRLSSGERQRLAFIRLLLNMPEALLLDEPTSHLDADSELKTEELVKHYQQANQCPVIWVSHDQAQIRRVAQRHFHLNNGQLQATDQ